MCYSVLLLLVVCSVCRLGGGIRFDFEFVNCAHSEAKKARERLSCTSEKRRETNKGKNTPNHKEGEEETNKKERKTKVQNHIYHHIWFLSVQPLSFVRCRSFCAAGSRSCWKRFRHSQERTLPLRTNTTRKPNRDRCNMLANLRLKHICVVF